MQNESTISFDNIDGLEAFSGKKIEKEELKISENVIPKESSFVLINDVFENFDND